jgi:small-conductance mechanosensitive channel
LLCGFLLAVTAAAAGAAPLGAPAAAEQAPSEDAILEVWNREIAVLRASRAGSDAQARASRASRRIRSLPDSRAGLDLWRIVFGVIRWIVNAFAWTVTAIAAYGWITFVLFQFPYTQPWAEALGGWLVELVAMLANAAAGAVPGLVIVAVILVAANGFTHLVTQLFAGVLSGRIQVRWLRTETAEATRRIVTVLVWVFALAIAYPYVPGSGSVAFQGISVLLGVMISLGSASLVNHAMSGLVVVYSRSFQPGDFVRVGETEGLVRELGALSTKIGTPWGEVTVPHGVAVSGSTINYTRPVRGAGSLVSTTVTIGYDAPWRQVHALLLEAAANTPGVRTNPAPKVLQRALSDFYVAYLLVAHVERPEQSPSTLSELHQQIQDRFNAAGVQIMSPHFALQPGSRVVVPQSEWFAPPATSPAREGRSR